MIGMRGADVSNSGGARERTIKVTLRKSLIGRHVRHKASVAGLGLRRIGQTAEVMDTPENRGMINKVSYLLSVQVGQ